MVSVWWLCGCERRVGIGGWRWKGRLPALGLLVRGVGVGVRAGGRVGGLLLVVGSAAAVAAVAQQSAGIARSLVNASTSVVAHGQSAWSLRRVARP